jgi:polyphosphate glucokinase
VAGRTGAVRAEAWEAGMTVLGIDIGGSGIKGAPVDVSTGTLTEERYRMETPQPSTIDHVVAAVAEVVKRFGEPDRIGVTFPGVVLGGVTKTAANVHKSWLDAPATELLSAAVGRPVTVLNDADAAGVAEMRFGAGRGERGVVIMLTLGTGIGSALFVAGRLVPNTELGHLELHGHDAEQRASERAREDEDLSWSEWAHRLQKYLRHVENLFWPDLLIIGGGVSKRSEKFLPHIDIRTRMVPAELQNNAGIVGAALIAASGD